MMSIERFESIFPQERLLISQAHLSAYESDALTAFHSRPAAVVVPEAP